MVQSWKLAVCSVYLLSQDFIIGSEKLNPKELVSKYYKEFPLQVRVSRDFYGNTNQTSISEGDKFSIHFIKKTEVRAIIIARFRGRAQRWFQPICYSNLTYRVIKI